MTGRWFVELWWCEGRERAAVFVRLYHSLSLSNVEVFPMLRSRSRWSWHFNRCRVVGTEAEGGNGKCFPRAARVGGNVCIIAIQVSEGDGIAAARDGFVVPSFDAAMIATSVLVTVMTGVADGAAGVILLA
jgi:hypothetical protein